MEQCVGRLITSSDSEEHGLLRADIVQACETYAKASCSSLGKQQLQQFFLLATAYKACLLRPRMWPKIFVHMTQYIRCELKIHDIDCLLRLVSAVGLLQMARSSTLQLDVTTVSITESGKKWYNKRTSHTGQLMSIVEEGVKHAELMELLQPWMDGSGNQAAPVSSADDSAKARDLLHSHEVLRAWAFAVLHWVKGYDRSNRFCLVQLSQELASMGPSFVEFMLGSGEPEQQMQQLRGLLQQLLTGPFAGYVQSMPAAEWLTQPGCRKTAAQAAAVGAAAAQVLPGEGIYLLDEQCPLLEIAINMFSPDADNMDTGDDADSENAGVEDTDHAGTSSNNNTLQLPPEVWSCAARKYSQHGLGSRKGGLASSVAELKRNIKRMWPDSDIVLVGAQASGADGPNASLDIVLQNVPHSFTAAFTKQGPLPREQRAGHCRLREVEKHLKQRHLLLKDFAYCSMGSGAPYATTTVLVGLPPEPLAVRFRIASDDRSAAAALVAEIKDTEYAMQQLLASPTLWLLHRVLVQMVDMSRTIHDHIGFFVNSHVMLRLLINYIRVMELQHLFDLDLGPGTTSAAGLVTCDLTEQGIDQQHSQLNQQGLGLSGKFTAQLGKQLNDLLLGFCEYYGSGPWTMTSDAQTTYTVKQIAEAAAAAATAPGGAPSFDFKPSAAVAAAAALAAQHPTSLQPAAVPCMQQQQEWSGSAVDAWSLAAWRQTLWHAHQNLTTSSPNAVFHSVCETIDQTLAQGDLMLQTNCVSAGQADATIITPLSMLAISVMGINPLQQQQQQQPQNLGLPIEGWFDSAVQCIQRAKQAITARDYKGAAHLALAAAQRIANAAGTAEHIGYARLQVLSKARDYSQQLRQAKYELFTATDIDATATKSHLQTSKGLLRRAGAEAPVSDREASIAKPRVARVTKAAEGASDAFEAIETAVRETAYLHEHLQTTAKKLAAAKAAAGNEDVVPQEPYMQHLQQLMQQLQLRAERRKRPLRRKHRYLKAHADPAPGCEY